MRRKAEQVPPTARMLRQYPSVTIWSVSVKTGSVEKHYKVTTYTDSDLIYLETWRGRAIPQGTAAKLMSKVRAAIECAKTATANKYRVVLTHGTREWRGVVEAENVDAAIRKAKTEQDFPERTTSETQRIE